MKKFLLILIMAVQGMTQVAAQDDYTPFVREGVQWVCYFNHFYEQDYMGFKPGQTFFTLELKGDTVIGGKQYKVMHKYGGIGVNPDDDTVLACLREEGRIVYAIIPEGMASGSFLVGYGELFDSSVGPCLYNVAKSGQEIILYEFNETESYYKHIYGLHKNLSYLGADKVDVGGQQAVRHTFSNYDCDFFFIEGIGYDGFERGYPLSYGAVVASDMYPYYLSHVMKDGKIIYKGVNYLAPAPNDGRMPMVREGMQWVFEKITVDHGVTKNEYYTYELRGDDPRGLPGSEEYNAYYRTSKLCRLYKGVKPDGSDGEIVSSIREIESAGYPILSINNRVLEKVAAEGRNLIRRIDVYPVGNFNELYWFDHKNTRSSLSYYINSQLSPRLLTSENFKLVDPIEIDGYSCNRYAYIGEDGEPLCYIIEGIGIDSRDMGDLLAPFTRLPDPDADYQEYCGLSHVIKDGKIIYKGMRYDAARVEEATHRYDVNGDGETNITDVTALIDLLLGSPSLQQQSSDVDASGEVTIADVTTLIDYLLSR